MSAEAESVGILIDDAYDFGRKAIVLRGAYLDCHFYLGVDESVEVGDDFLGDAAGVAPEADRVDGDDA